jgi:hypothetical protein
MRIHPYLRAYMAGIVVPTVFIVLATTVFAIVRYGIGLNLPVERAMVFPLAAVPSLWGVWNMLHLALRDRVELGLGLHGALLPLILVPSGVLLARAFGIFEVSAGTAALFAPVGMAGYFLLWKYVVAFLNAEIGIA